MQGGWVHILANRPNGTLHIGVTADLARRVWKHRQGIGSVFAKRYLIERQKPDRSDLCPRLIG